MWKEITARIRAFAPVEFGENSLKKKVYDLALMNPPEYFRPCELY